MTNVDKLLDHYQRQRNRGSFAWDATRILTGRAQNELYNDLLQVHFQWAMLPCPDCGTTGKTPSAASGSSDIEFVNCEFCRSFGSVYLISDARHISTGCVWLMAAADWFTEYIKGRSVIEIAALREDDFIALSGLPWVGHHCAGLVRETTLDALKHGFTCLIDPA